MLDILVFVITSIGIGILFAIPGFVFGSFLEKHEIATNRAIDVLIFSLFFVFVKRIWYEDIPYSWLAIILILGTTVGVYSMEIYWSIKKDRN